MLRALLASVLSAVHVAGSVPTGTSYVAPDRSVRAIVSSVGMGSAESRIDIVASSGRLVTRRSFASDDGEHGFGVVRAEWTADGRFFVVSLESSGGHQPWHRLTVVFSRRARSFASLDAYVGSVTSDFVLLANDRIAVSRLVPGGDGAQERMTFSLARLESASHATKSAGRRSRRSQTESSGLPAL